MEPDVVEIAPPLASSSRKRRQKQVVIPEVIDVERYEFQNGGGSGLNKNFEKKNKGKAVQDTATDASGPVDLFGSDPVMSSDYLIDEQDHFYLMFQDLLDSKDIPTDVEVPIPWFHDLTNQEVAKSGGSSSSHANNGHKSGVTRNSQKVKNAIASPSLSSKLWKPILNSKSSQSSGLALPENSQAIYSSAKSLPKKYPNSKSWDPFFGVSGSIFGGFEYPSLVPPEPLVNVTGAHPYGWGHTMPPAPLYPHASSSLRQRKEDFSLAKNSSRVQKKAKDFLGNYLVFKRFDTVEDFSDHHYATQGNSSKQHGKSWVKRVQKEWKILEKDLPDTIFVRAYESRMDLLRAVIIGAEGTPYHDGLFFFDICFPDNYPNVPPEVYYHSGGLRINPNLYECGRVCLSLLGTWSGDTRESWIPKVSTTLQVLVSIQALVLNQNPYFNEPGFEGSQGTQMGEASSKAYSEDTFILSLKTMVYNMRRPPKHFEDFVWGHFFSRALDILKACKAYTEGAPVGSVVKGGVQDVEESGSSSSDELREEVDSFVQVVVSEFTILGVKGMDQAASGNNRSAVSAKTRKKSNKRDRGSSDFLFS